MTTATVTALIIPADAPPRTEQIEADYREYQGFVGGFIEGSYGVTDTDLRVTFYSNEHAMILDLPINIVATALWHRLNPLVVRNILRGTVIALGANPPDDSDIPVLVTRMAYAIHRQINPEN